MPVLKPGEELIAYETDIRSGAIGYTGVNDAYDLYLAKVRSGDHVLIVFMKIQFFFRDGPLLASMFGHMLGLDDEYLEGSPHRNDEASIMNIGETIHPRHDAVYVGWLEEKLAEKKAAWSGP